jgi:hypothetical protein
MGNAVFANMVGELTRESYYPQIEISLTEYEDWQKQYTWDALQDMRYGQSFCNQFNIHDSRLYYTRDWVSCDILIRKEYITRP